jgi:ubiquinone/menaquinone biosynthesis C-methylase UbiE
MNTEMFTGKAEVYAKARPGYPAEAVDYIASLAPVGAVFADIGAGTGKFTGLSAKRGYELYAVEPNADMRGQLAVTLSSYPNAKVISGTAEATTLPDHCADIITCAQALHWFDPEAFRAECRRIGKPGAIIVSIYNSTPDIDSFSCGKMAVTSFFTAPAVRDFPNPIYYTRESWLQYMTSHSSDPLPSDPAYEAHVAEMNAVFDRESSEGLLYRGTVTNVYSEVI